MKVALGIANQLRREGRTETMCLDQNDSALSAATNRHHRRQPQVFSLIPLIAMDFPQNGNGNENFYLPYRHRLHFSTLQLHILVIKMDLLYFSLVLPNVVMETRNLASIFSLALPFPCGEGSEKPCCERFETHRSIGLYTTISR